MAYFDSPKNRALWEKELNGLDQLRSEREKEGFKPQSEEDREVRHAAEGSLVREINLQELEEIEKAARAAQAPEGSVRKELARESYGREREIEMESPVLGAPVPVR